MKMDSQPNDPTLAPGIEAMERICRFVAESLQAGRTSGRDEQLEAMEDAASTLKELVDVVGRVLGSDANLMYHEREFSAARRAVDDHIKSLYVLTREFHSWRCPCSVPICTHFCSR